MLMLKERLNPNGGACPPIGLLRTRMITRWIV